MGLGIRVGRRCSDGGQGESIVLGVREVVVGWVVL